MELPGTLWSGFSSQGKKSRLLRRLLLDARRDSELLIDELGGSCCIEPCELAGLIQVVLEHGGSFADLRIGQHGGADAQLLQGDGHRLIRLMALEPPFEMTLRAGEEGPAAAATGGGGDQDALAQQMEEPRFDSRPNLDHPAIAAMSRNGRELMVSMMHSNPALRLSATEALDGIEAHLEYLMSKGIGPVSEA